MVWPVRLSLTLTRSVLAYEVREGYATRNMAESVAAAGKAAGDREVYTEQQMAALSSAVEAHRLGGVLAPGAKWASLR